MSDPRKLREEANRLERHWSGLCDTYHAAKKIADNADDAASRAWGEYVWVEKLAREAEEAERTGS